MITNSREVYDSQSAEWDVLARKKAYAVGILVMVWSGRELPPQMIKEARQIRREMKKNGTWKSA